MGVKIFKVWINIRALTLVLKSHKEKILTLSHLQSSEKIRPLRRNALYSEDMNKSTSYTYLSSSQTWPLSNLIFIKSNMLREHSSIICGLCHTNTADFQREIAKRIQCWHRKTILPAAPLGIDVFQYNIKSPGSKSVSLRKLHEVVFKIFTSHFTPIWIRVVDRQYLLQKDKNESGKINYI